MSEKDEFWKSRIYTKDVDENFDNITGTSTQDSKYCVFCGKEVEKEHHLKARMDSAG